MKLILNNKREFVEPNGTVVMAAIKSLKHDDVLLLEDGADFVDCWCENENSFNFQHQDGKTLQIFETERTITADELASIFMRFLSKDDTWKDDFKFKLAPDQPDLGAILDVAEHGGIGSVLAPVAPLKSEPVTLVEETSAAHAAPVVEPQIYAPSSSLVWARGPVNCKILCPHCGTGGKVHIKKESRKVGVSGGKATGALLTAGLSLFVTGLSRKEKVTAAYCGNCEAEWSF